MLPITGDDDPRRMSTDRFFGGVDGRLQNLRSMLRYIDQGTPAQQSLWQWLRLHTSAEKGGYQDFRPTPCYATVPGS